MPKMSARLRYLLTTNHTKFLAFCGIVRALRDQPRAWDFSPIVLALIVPREEDVKFYAEAAEYVGYSEHFSLRLGIEQTLVQKITSSRDARSFDLPEAIDSHQRVIIVSADEALLADGSEYMCDAIVRVDPIDARHVKAAAKLCFKQHVGIDQARLIASISLRMLASIWRKGRNADDVIAALEAAESSKFKSSGRTFEELHGMDAAVEWGKELARDLSDWRKGKIAWEDVDRGVLLSGPTGCGKTTFALALGNTCNVHLVLTSLGEWQARGHLGDMLKAMRSSFSEARNNAPAVLFIDEIDSVGDRRRFGGNNAHYNMQVVNGLLECMDGAIAREGVVVVGATNYPERLDPALLRPGRLDRHIRVEYPDSDARENILKSYLRGHLVHTELNEVIERTEGWTGAGLERLVREARRIARRERRSMAVEDLVASLPVRFPLSEKMLWRIAAHEAGHAVVQQELEVGQLEAVTLNDFIPNGSTEQVGGGVSIIGPEVPERTRAEMLNHVAMLLGGLAAEEFVLGERSAGGGGESGSDLHLATKIALQVEASFGLGENLVFFAGADERDLLHTLRINSGIQRRVDTLLANEFQRVLSIIESKREELHTIAENLLRRRKLSGQEVATIMGRPSVKERVGETLP